MVRLLCLLVVAATRMLWSADVLTQHNDNARTGLNADETILTPATVSTTTFGKLFTLKTTASVNGQVLYVHDLAIGGATHNVIFAYTSTGSNGSPCAIYAFDADAEGQPLWSRQLPKSAEGTTSTPAIDAATKTMFLVSKDKDNKGPTRLHAIDITTGAERDGSPVMIEGSVTGAGVTSVDGRLPFTSAYANCRPGVLYEKGLIYIAFARAGDGHPYHGWVFCYAYDGTAFTQRGAMCTTPDPDDGTPGNFSKDGAGVWQSGKGLASDGEAVYCTTGNGNFSADHGGRNFGMCFLKLHPGDLAVLDWFAESKARKDSDDDNDLGNCGPLIIPGSHVLFGGATKYGRSYLVDTTALGHFSETKDACLQSLETPALAFPNGQNGVVWTVSPTQSFIYLWCRPQAVAQYAYDSTTRSIPTGAPTSQGSSHAGGGAGLTVTAHGTADGILWCLGSDAVVYALDAAHVDKDLWTSAQNAARDALGSVGHYQFPTVVGGKAYMPTGTGSIVVYGLLPH